MSAANPRHRPFGALALVCLPALAVLAGTVPASAVSIGGGTPFGLAPVTQAGSQPSSYFQLSIGPGRSEAEKVILTNFGSTEKTFRISASAGTTAPNSGVAYTGAFATCTGSACWVSGLPPAVTLGAGEAETLPFRVAVPAGTADGQYLAGITAQPTTSTGSINFHQQGASARAVIVNQITVGVAVTVGDATALRPDLVITKVEGTAVGTTPRLEVTLKNEGQTFSKGKGTASCTTAKGTLAFPVLTGTILPGESATVPVNVLGAASHAVLDCSVSLGYSPTAQTSWHGTVTLPVINPRPEYHIAPGVYSSLPPAKLPRWAIGLLAGAGAVVLGLLIAFAVLFVRHRRQQTIRVTR